MSKNAVAAAVAAARGGTVARRTVLAPPTAVAPPPPTRTARACGSPPVGVAARAHAPASLLGRAAACGASRACALAQPFPHFPLLLPTLGSFPPSHSRSHARGLKVRLLAGATRGYGASPSAVVLRCRCATRFFFYVRPRV
jgi:hypothetical protein